MGEEEIKVGMITKRAQQKKSFGPVNYKDRVFVLTRSKLAYYEGSDHARGKMRGSFEVSTISFVGPLSDKALNRTSAFQIIHDGCILYCCAKNEGDRDRWIQAIKKECQSQRQSVDMQAKFHPDIFHNGKWQCCGTPTKNDQGCTVTVSAENYNKPLPEIPEGLSTPSLYPGSVSDDKRFSSDSHSSSSLPRSQPQQQYPSLPSKPYQPAHNSGVNNIATAVSRFALSHDQSNGHSSSWPNSSYPDPAPPLNSKYNYPQPSHQAYPSQQPMMPSGVNADVLTKKLGQVMETNPNTTFDDEPMVPSYPHYVKGSRQHETQIESKSYEHTTPRVKKPVPPPQEASRMNKIVVAIYNFEPMENGDIPLVVGGRYTVVDDSRAYWWKVRDVNGAEGHAPSNYLQDAESDGMETMSWFQKDMSRQRAEYLLKQDGKEGSFIVRNSTQSAVIYTLSVVSKGGHISGPFQVKHYHIKKEDQGLFYLSEKHPKSTVMELINYHKHNAGGLITRLRSAPACLADQEQPPTPLFSNSEYEVKLNELEILKELGSGQFGTVNLALFRKKVYVAVKIMKENTMEEESFVEEAEVMTRLHHKNLVSLYGVVTKERPICIVTEFMEEGCLLDYLRKNSYLQTHPDTLLDICHQVCDAMRYLEAQNLIHRDLAARNCLVGKNMEIKVADFGLTRYVLDDEYTSSLGSKFPIKWAAPEVLNYTKFSSKSDVWAFGVLMWELFTGGKMPFAALSNPEVVEQVAHGMRLSRPVNCPHEVYRVMQMTWETEPEQRPAFLLLFDLFYDLIDEVAAKCLKEGMYDA